MVLHVASSKCKILLKIVTMIISILIFSKVIMHLNVPHGFQIQVTTLSPIHYICICDSVICASQLPLLA